MASPRLLKAFLDRSSSRNRASSLPIARAFTTSSSFLFAISSLPLHAPKLSISAKSTTKKASSELAESNPKPSLAAARLARIQSKVTHSKLNLTNELHRQRYPYLAEIKVACYLPPPSTSSPSTFSSSILPSLTTSLEPYSSRFPLQLLNLPPPHLSTSISGLFTFTRRTSALYEHVKRLWVEDRIEGETDTLQATTLVVLEEQEMMSLVKGKKEGAGFVQMVERVREFTGVGKGQLANGEMADESTKGRVICVVLGWSCWEGKDREDRKWREKVVGDLVVKGGCFVQDVSTAEEATSFLWTSFGHIAVRRHSRLDNSTLTPPPPPIKVRRTFDTKAPRKGVNSLDTFGLMHQKITRGSEDKLRAITNEFRSLRKLLERYDQEEGEGGGGGGAALQELYPVGENGKPQQKKIGPAFSKKVHKIWTSDDPQELV